MTIIELKSGTHRSCEVTYAHAQRICENVGINFYAGLDRNEDGGCNLIVDPADFDKVEQFLANGAYPLISDDSLAELQAIDDVTDMAREDAEVERS